MVERVPKLVSDAVTEIHQCSAVKSPLGAQTVLGDRHDPDYENLFISAVGRLRNSPERTFQRLGTQVEVRRKQQRITHMRAAVKRSRRAQTVLGDRHDLIYEILLQVPSAACGTRPAEFFNGWARTQKHEGPEKSSSENLIRQRGQRNDLNPGEFASRASLRSCLGARRRAR